MIFIDLLRDPVVSVNVLRSLHLNINLAAINLVADHGTQVVQPVHPQKRVPTQMQTREVSRLEQECHTFSFTEHGIWVCRKFCETVYIPRMFSKYLEGLIERGLSSL